MTKKTTKTDLNPSQSKFYTAVDDITILRGKKGNMQRVYVDYDNDIQVNDLTDEEKKTVKKTPYDVRFFAKKFVDNPYTAILNAVYQNPKDSCNVDVQNNFFTKLRYNPDNKTYIYEEYVTTGTGLPPKAHHWNQFQAGAYELIMFRHEIQILSTEIETIDLDTVRKVVASTENAA